MAADAAASSAGCTHRDLDLPQPTTAVTAAAYGQFGAVWATAVRITSIRVAAVAGAIWLAVSWSAGTIGHGVRGRRADRIRDWIASATQSTLEALVSSTSIKSPEALTNLDEIYAPTVQKGLWARL